MSLPYSVYCFFQFIPISSNILYFVKSSKKCKLCHKREEPGRIMRLYYIIMSRYVAVYTSDAEVELRGLLNCIVQPVPRPIYPI